MTAPVDGLGAPFLSYISGDLTLSGHVLVLDLRVLGAPSLSWICGVSAAWTFAFLVGGSSLLGCSEAARPGLRGGTHTHCKAATSAATLISSGASSPRRQARQHRVIHQRTTRVHQAFGSSTCESTIGMHQYDNAKA